VFQLASGRGFSFLRPLLQHARPLPDRQSDPRPVFDCCAEYLPCLIQIAARIQHALNSARLRSLLDFVVVAVVRQQRLVCLFVGSIAHDSQWRHRLRARLLGQSIAPPRPAESGRGVPSPYRLDRAAPSGHPIGRGRLV
jgi:hypothetical protein